MKTGKNVLMGIALTSALFVSAQEPCHTWSRSSSRNDVGYSVQCNGVGRQ